MYSLLYVDDEPGLLEIGKLFLEHTGDFSVTCVLSAKEALEKLKEKQFDAIIADYQMPGMDGIGLLKEVRARHGSLPYILFTGKGREEVVIEAINNGADFYLQKGGDPRSQFAELSHKIRQAIGRVQSEVALATSEKRLADIINFLPDATFAIDTAGVVIAWNRAMEDLSGIPAAQILGKGNLEYACAFYGERRRMLIDLIITPDKQFEADHYTYTVHAPTTLTGETIYERPGKPRLYLWGKASTLFNDRGEQIGAIESIRDITERKLADDELRAANAQLAASAEELQAQYDELAAGEKKVQESEEKYRTLVEHSQDGIFITQDGHIVFYNRGFREILGYPEGELDNAPIETVLAPEDREMVVGRHYARLAGNQLPEVYECLFLARDGSKRRVKLDVGLAPYQGKPATIGTIHDVTKERQREEALRISEEQYRSLIENLQDVVYRTDRDGRLVMVSPSGVALLGYASQHDLLGKPVAETFYHDQEKRQEFLERVLREGAVKNVEIELRHRDGSPITVSTSSHLYYDSAGNVLGVEGVLHDITDIKKKEAELKKTYEQIAATEEELRQQYRELKESTVQIREGRRQLEEITATIPGVVYQFYARPDGSRGISYRGGRTQEIFGAPDDTSDFLAWFTDHVHPDDREKFVQSINAALAVGGPWQFEGRFIRPEGRTIWFRGMSSPARHGDEQIYSGVLVDITKRKLAELALRESEVKYRLLAENSPDMIYYVDTQGLIRYVNTRAARVLNATPDDITGKHLTDIFRDVFAKRHLDAIRRVMETRTVLRTEITETFPSGTLHIAVRLAPVIAADGSVAGVIGLSHDISNRKRMEDALRESEARYRLLVENSHDIIYTIDPEGIMTFVSPAWTRHLGHPVTEVTGRSFKDFVHPEDIPACEAFLARVVSTGMTGEGIGYRVFHADGSIRIHQSTVSPVTGEDGKVISYVGCANDITDLKQTQTALQESNKKLHLLSSITRHDVANQLTVMQGYVQLVQAKKPDPVIQDFLAKIATAVRTAQHQIEFTRSYQDLGIKAPAWHRIADLVVSAQLSDIHVTCTCGSTEIFADPMISRVFYNLFDNAKRHGRKGIRIAVGCKKEDDMLVLTVEDDGVGVPADKKEKIFGKGYGNNTGFGLFLSREILAITGLAIHETGVEGQGARFEISVPKGAFRNFP